MLPPPSYYALQTLVAGHVRLDLKAALALAAERQPVAVAAAAQAEALTFIVRRLEQLLVDGCV